MAKPSRETIQKRVATRRRSAAIRKRKREARLHGPMGPEIAAKTRLEIDGACSSGGVRRRIPWLAHERKLAPAEIEKAMTCRLYHLAAFIKRQNLSYDWLLYGDLKGLRKMPAKKESPAIFTATDVIKFYADLTTEQRREITLRLAEMLAKAVGEQS